MKKIIGLFATVAMLSFVNIAVASFEPPPGGDEKKETVCHVPPGNPENPQTIEVSVNAAPAHMEHGDTPGECA